MSAGTLDGDDSIFSVGSLGLGDSRMASPSAGAVGVGATWRRMGMAGAGPGTATGSGSPSRGRGGDGGVGGGASRRGLPGPSGSLRDASADIRAILEDPLSVADVDWTSSKFDEIFGGVPRKRRGGMGRGSAGQGSAGGAGAGFGAGATAGDDIRGWSH
jgi:hypothetical protein